MNPWKNKRILVTGGTGFVGANLIRRLIAEQAQVTVLARDPASSWRLASLRDSITFFPGDLTRATDIEASVAQARPDIIFHLATAREENSSANYPAFVAINTLGPHHLLSAARLANVKMLVCAGSQLEYGPHQEPHRETDRIQPNTYHGMTKGAAATYLQEAGRHQTPPATVILRLFHVYGPWESPKRLIPTAIRAALRGDTLRTTSQDIRRDYIHVDDVVAAFLLAAQRPDLSGEIFNIGSGHQTSNEAVIRLIERVVDKPLAITAGAYPPHLTDAPFRVADISKARKDLGWEPRLDLMQGLRTTVEWVEAYDRNPPSS